MTEAATVHLSLKIQDIESMVICLAIGTLRAIDRSAMDVDAGIWCLGRPAFWQPLREQGLISGEVAARVKGLLVWQQVAVN